MAVCVSLINMKGGVGKTTLASQIAWHATLQNDKKVLLIDLDPQANASQSVMSPQKWVKYLDAGGLTVADIFEQFTPTGTASGAPTALNPSTAIYKRVEYSDGSLLHIVPSRLELSWTLRNPTGKETLLARFVSKVEANYDLIVIDCSPTDSILTDAAYHCSRYVLVPIRAEFLASIGFPLLNRSLAAFRMRHEDKQSKCVALSLMTSCAETRNGSISWHAATCRRRPAHTAGTFSTTIFLTLTRISGRRVTECRLPVRRARTAK